MDFAGDQFRVKGAIAFEKQGGVPDYARGARPAHVQLAGRETAGTIIWAAGLKALRDYVCSHK